MSEKKYKVELNERQIQLVSDALDMYSRIGHGQFEEILRHPCIEQGLWNASKHPAGRPFHISVNLIRKHLFLIKEITELSHPTTVEEGTQQVSKPEGIANKGIYHENTSKTSRESFDIHQDIRHYLWEERHDPKDEEADSLTSVASSVHYTSDNHEKVEIENTDK